MNETLKLRLEARRDLTSEITEFTFASSGDTPLPPYEPGAHLTLNTPSGNWRSYSLTGVDTSADRYVIAVKREEGGQGGSKSMHADLSIGNLIEARAPKNAFSLEPAPQYLLIAGGIGITPILSMFFALRKDNKSVQLIYLTRSAEDTAYLDALIAQDATCVTVHHDNGDPEQIFDLWPYLQTPDDCHLYYCGPAGLMQAIYLNSIHWPRSQVHSEDFAGIASHSGTAHPFRLRRAATGELFNVPADKSILDVLRENGIAYESSCESGTCGTCRMTLTAGEVAHRDIVLSNEERHTAIMPCVSRAAGEEITVEF
ncbi:PDR/VanB family oxidoreductase [Epibacterium ulvae]|uniref:PDR/VanB family oxidoreductase n=1 Tax=Epibacterium ulvae TaxID=1156985 RepID=UPI0024927FD1|nr:PDR/VanB family oxidoreductase [Epibacterium ulvae]